MRTLAVFLVVAACGGSPDSNPTTASPAIAPDPAPDDEIEAPAGVDEVNAGAPEVVSPPPSKDAQSKDETEAPAGSPRSTQAPPEVASRPSPKVPPIYDHLRDEPGDVPGLAGWSIQRQPDAAYCGGIKIITVRGKKELAAEDQPLADVYALSFPIGLDFPPEPEKKRVKEASLKRFNDWLTTMKTVGGEARKHYEASLKSGKGVEAHVRAVARIAQINLRLASVISRAPIPTSVRTGDRATEKIDAYCGALLKVAEPILADGELAIDACASKLAKGSAGWWATVCKVK